MAKINTLNYQTVASWNGSQDLFVVEQPDGTKVATPAMVKQYVLGNSIDDIYSVMGQNGAKNLIPYPFPSDSYSQRGIKFTALSDGTINANGTNDGTGNSTFNFVSFTLSKGSYALNGCPTQTGTNYRCGVVRSSDSVTLASDFGSGAKFTLDADTVVRIFVQVYSGKTANNIIFKPMIRLASDTDNTYEPYAKTNKELTDQISRLTTPTLLWEGDATAVGTTYNMTGNYTDYKYLLVTAKTNVEEKNMLIPTSRISANIIFPDFLSAGAWNSSTNAFTYNSMYGIKFTAANIFKLDSLSYNNANWILRPRAIYGIG